MYSRLEEGKGEAHGNMLFMRYTPTVILVSRIDENLPVGMITIGGHKQPDMWVFTAFDRITPFWSSHSLRHIARMIDAQYESDWHDKDSSIRLVDHED